MNGFDPNGSLCSTRPGAMRAALAGTHLTVLLLASALAYRNAAGQELAAAATPTEECERRVHLPTTIPGDLYSDLRRTSELAGAAPLRPGVALRPSSERRERLCADGLTAGTLAPAAGAPVGAGTRGPALRALTLTLRAELNSGYPVDRNNGVLWSGRGISSAVTGGIEIEWGPLSAAIAPALVYQQNRAFAIVDSVFPGFSRYAYPWHGPEIDWPQRFGGEPFWTADPGQSYLRLDGLGLKAGISTENLRWGPAQRYPIVLSSTAPGFVHGFTGTSRPLDLGIGKLEAEILWGELRESRYFDEDAGNDRRLIGGMILDFEPRWMPGLFLGGTRVYLTTIPPQGLPASEYLAFFDLPITPTVRENRPGNGIGSLFARWVFPESEVEVYAEWAREDYSLNLTDFIKEPDHSQAYTLGLQKVWVRQDRWIRFTWELTHLQQSITFRSGRPAVTYYVHGGVSQGYTHRGQLLGSFIGPGSDAQYLAVDVLRPERSLGVYLERVRRDDDAYYRLKARDYAFHGHDVEITAGLRGALHLRALSLSWRAAYSHRENRNFLGLEGGNWSFREELNWNAEVAALWRPRLP